MKDKTAGLILAAGYSRRMGRFKPLLPIGDRTAIEVLTDTYFAAGMGRTYIVTGFNREALEGLIRAKGVSEIYNKRFDEGMFSSIQAGVNGILLNESKKFKGLLLGLVDCPLVSQNTVEAILEKAADDTFVIPCYQGKKGHPIYIPEKYFEKILAYEGPLGLKGFMNQYRDCIEYIDTNDETIVVDMDDWSGYEEILDFYRREKNENRVNQIDTNSLKQLLGKKRLFLIRHCEQIQMGEKIFLGQVDLPLSEEGIASAEKIGENLLPYKIYTDRIYTSDLKRAKQTSQLIRDFFMSEPFGPDLQLIEKKEFREINLGDWDGKPIEEIKKKFPAEYLERGRNLLGFKGSPLSENFYDLQYRVLKELKKILADTVDEDILLVSHAGVINVILSNYNNVPLEEQLKSKLGRGAIHVLQNRED